MNCDWAQALTKYDCQPVTGLKGQPGLRIGTPFSLPDGAAINLYMMEAGSHHILISDNGDTLAHLSSLGLDISHHTRLRALRDVAHEHGVSLRDEGDFTILSQQKNAAHSFARSVTALLAIAQWAREQLRSPHANPDLIAEAEPYLVARHPELKLVRNFSVQGASMAEHKFDFAQGDEVIDIIAPSAQATGGIMRKVGDILNGPFGEKYRPLIIVDDRHDRQKAESEMGILASLARTQPFSRLAFPLH